VSAKTLWVPVLLLALIPLAHYLQHRAPPALPPGLPAAPLAPPRKSLNDATPQDVAALPGIGMEFALRLIAARPVAGFQDWGQVDAVKGVGESRLKLLQERFDLP
jgi:hypothetical protein